MKGAKENKQKKKTERGPGTMPSIAQMDTANVARADGSSPAMKKRKREYESFAEYVPPSADNSRLGG